MNQVLTYTLKIFLLGAAAPISTTPLAPAAVVCNLPPTSETSTINPSRAVWDDDANAGKQCQWQDVPGGPLLSLPLGGYSATLVRISPDGSAETAKVEFTRAVVAPGPRTIQFALFPTRDAAAAFASGVWMSDLIAISEVPDGRVIVWFWR